MSGRADTPFASRDLSPASLVAALIGAALVTWIVTIDRMRGMDAGPGTDLGGLGWFIGVWVTMMAAMMLPSAAPMVLVGRRVSGRRAGRGPRPIIATWPSSPATWPPGRPTGSRPTGASGR